MTWSEILAFAFVASLPVMSPGSNGVLITKALNPKVSMFDLAAFRQLIYLGDATVSASLMLVSVQALINALWFGAMVMLFSQLSSMAKSGRFQRWLKAVTGVVFIGFGAKLASYRVEV
ncbi:LysE family translocator [Pseudophaeobacter arcticus]|uniref:LysE family translocator n=1 Tax=Pseudophaeobacter arcticus TaxID=385492 RepID=UPI003A9718AF